MKQILMQDETWIYGETIHDDGSVNYWLLLTDEAHKNLGKEWKTSGEVLKKIYQEREKRV